MHSQQRQVEQRLDHEVAIGHGVEGVLEPAPEPEVVGHAVGIQRQGRPRQGAGPEGAHVHPHHAEQHAVEVAHNAHPWARR